ncbi:plasmid stabilization protein [Sphingobium subterraneum]|uniref:Chromosome partitioning protein ParB n=1 Tax=Sphingobium subterraneum TaxID=627688 RepID=A0A841J7X0_9SPHN|nr:plasmid stabilization protein [Sphingobium subterraneum]MBB6125646.1 hypothetical protein [Sphingobium subterraneum]
MADVRETLDTSWTEHDRTQDRFAAFSALDDDAKAGWLAYCVARSLEASIGAPRKSGQMGPDQNDLHDHLAGLMGINPASHWRPTAANYFDRVSKQTLLAHINEVGGPTMAASFMGSKKGDLSASCERLFAGETIVAPEDKAAALAWVPAHMRFRVLASPDAEAEGVAVPDEEAAIEGPAEPIGEPMHEDDLSGDTVDEPELIDA